ncbi:hypothetical protein GJ496_009362, partial [Pomphorhynchus laevis]
DLFKVVAKHISHQILNKKPSSLTEVRHLATTSINNAFYRIQRVKSDRDVVEFV